MTKPNILLIVLDSARAKNMSLYGYENETTPFLEEFSERATVFERAWAPSTWSLPSHVSMFTGHHVAQHGVVKGEDKIDTNELVFEELRRDGYTTGVFSENTWLTEMNVGLKDCFDTVETDTHLPYRDALNPTNFVLEEGKGQFLEYFKRSLNHERPIACLMNGIGVKARWDYPTLVPDRFFAHPKADDYVDEFINWERDTDDSWAACINLMDPHLPYSPQDKFNRWADDEVMKLQNNMEDKVWEFHGGQKNWWQRKALESLYDGAILQTDNAVERLVSHLKDVEQLENTLVVITADHGEGFGEASKLNNRRVAGHGSGIHEALLRVPLVVKTPGQKDSKTISQISGIRGFADSVRNIVGEGDPLLPYKQEKVLAMYGGMEQPMMARAEKYVDDVSLYDKIGRVVYEESPEGGTVKHMTWGEDAGKTLIRDPANHWLVERNDGKIALDTFDQLDSVDVNIKASREEVDPMVDKRLERLGYK